METHHMLEGHEEEHSIGTVTFASAVVQIIFLDVVFALDSSSPQSAWWSTCG
jgi:predicted tellurium resistance membrane protein TerC